MAPSEKKIIEAGIIGGVLIAVFGLLYSVFSAQSRLIATIFLLLGVWVVLKFGMDHLEGKIVYTFMMSFFLYVFAKIVILRGELLFTPEGIMVVALLSGALGFLASRSTRYGGIAGLLGVAGVFFYGQGGLINPQDWSDIILLITFACLGYPIIDFIVRKTLLK